jgi:hypothetical protein
MCLITLSLRPLYGIPELCLKECYKQVMIAAFRRQLEQIVSASHHRDEFRIVVQPAKVPEVRPRVK